jgi:predicted NBD/HSP70 family sugar kinase
MTFPELGEIVDASEPTARRALRKLLDRGLVAIVGSRESTGGRPANVYGLVADAGALVGVHLELPGLHMVVTNLAGEVLHQEHISHDYNIDANEAVQETIRFTQEAMARFGREQVLGVGVAAPGYRDSSGTILAIGRDPAWQNVPLAARLQRETNLPVLVENDVDCMALAELEFDDSMTLDDFLYLGFTEGVKASLVLNGQVYSGPFGNAGSIGHTTVVPDGPLCSCGNRGCLEAVASVRALHSAFEQRRATEVDTNDSLLAIEAIDDRMERFHSILNAAAEGEPLCQDLVHQVLSYLAIAIANLVNIFQVKLVIVGGELSPLSSGLQTYLGQSVREKLAPILSNNLTIRYVQDTRDYKAALGAAQKFLSEYLPTLIASEVANS